MGRFILRWAVWGAGSAALLWGPVASLHAGSQESTRSLLKMDEHSNGKTVKVHKLDTIELSLAENPTTGYRWDLRSSGEPVCRLKDTSFDSPAERIGQGGRRRWLFQVVASGQATIELAYQRSFEREKRPAKTFQVTIQANH
jgi:inhibitor of cysteine peptidase